MALLVWIVLAVCVLIAAIAFLQRFYHKSTRDTVLIRTGAGGRRIALDSGFFALPILHRVEEINMRVHRVRVARRGDQGLLSRDRMRADAEVEMLVRVGPAEADVATAAQTWGARALRTEVLAEHLEARLLDVMQACATQSDLNALHAERAAFVDAIRTLLAPELARGGLQLDHVALLHLDQTPLAQLSQDNAFNAQGSRRLAELIADERKRRAETEAEAEIGIARARLLAERTRIDVDREQREAQEAARLATEGARCQTDAEVARLRETGQRDIELARINRQADIDERQLAHTKALAERRLGNELALETQRVDQAIALAARQISEAEAAIDGEQALARLALEKERSLTRREEAVAERDLALTLAQARRQADGDAVRVQSEASRIAALAQAEAEAIRIRAEADKARGLALAETEAAQINAGNGQNLELTRFKLELARIQTMPTLAEKLAKPLERIDSFRIHHISGLGAPAGPDGNAAGPGGPMDAIYNLALQLPVLRKLGETLGTDLDLNVPQLARAEADHLRAVADSRRSTPQAGRKDPE